MRIIIKKIKLLGLILILFLLSSCSNMEEPNNFAYITALGIDKGSHDGDYAITIQFAKPVKISGGSEGGGSGSGEDITEIVSVEAPNIYGALNLANQLVSKKFTLSHAKLIVFSEEVAQEGIADFTETMTRNEEIRPNIYMAVSLCKAQEYLNQVKPMIEISPVKYYQLIYENYTSIFSPNMLSLNFYFNQKSNYKDNVLAIASVVEKEKGESQKPDEQGSESTPKSGSSEEGGSSEGSGSSEGGSSSESGGSEGGKSESGAAEKNGGMEATQPLNESGFEYHMANYIAGEIPRETKNRSEAIGMAVFSGDKMVGTMGAIECELYNIVMNTFDVVYTTFYREETKESPVSVKIEQDKKSKIKVSLDGDVPIITITLTLDGEFYSLPVNFVSEKDVQVFEHQVNDYTAQAMEKFLYRTSRELETDIVGFGAYAKRCFKTNIEFDQYDWIRKYKNAKFNVNVDFRIRRSGLTNYSEGL